MFKGLFKQDTQDAMLQLINKQSEMIELQKQAIKEKDEIIQMQKRLISICEQQIELEKENNKYE